MKQISYVRINEQDYELLTKYYPKDPCEGCGSQYSCFGCPQKREWEEVVKPLKDAGIYDVWLQLMKAHSLQCNIDEFQKKINQIKSEIKEKGFDVDRLLKGSAVTGLINSKPLKLKGF